MNVSTFIELIGYTGSALVIISMLMTSVVKLRIINAVGSVIFATYAFCIHSYPTAAMQICLFTINAVNLYKLLNVKKDYSAVKLASGDSFLHYFLENYFEDIKKYFPDFELPQNVSGKDAYLVCCNKSPAGVLVFSQNQQSSLSVELDYTTPAYRDCSVGKFLYSYLAKEGVSELRAKSSSSEHEKYLKKMGFVESGSEFLKKI